MEPWLKELYAVCENKEDSGVPVYRRLLDVMSQMISGGLLPDGTRLPPDSVLAQQLGISHITWAKVLNALSQRGIIERSRKRGTFIRRPQRTEAMKEGRANAVAVFMDALNPADSNHIFLETLQQELSAAGFRPAFISAAESGFIQYAQVMNALRTPEFCGGLIWSLLNETQVNSILSMRPASWPLVFMAADHAAAKKFEHDLVLYDDFQAGFAAAEKLIRSGADRFACLLCERHLLRNGFDRIKGIEQAVSRAGLPLENVEIIRIDEDFEKKFDLLLKRSSSTALVAAAPLEIKLLRAELVKRQLAPEVLGRSIGFSPDGFEISLHAPFPLCRFDTAELCRSAVRIFCQRLRNPGMACTACLIPGILDF
ncbi:MAG: GntR family transcriptional regulator [Lentisphaeria bacterium]|nr:GntR family transcriptional regulator [Lentisphaeria bacterium]